MKNLADPTTKTFTYQLHGVSRFIVESHTVQRELAMIICEVVCLTALFLLRRVIDGQSNF